MKFEEFRSWAFQIILVGIGGFAVAELKDLTKSVNNLNTQVAVIISENNTTKTIIKDLDERIKTLERGQ